MYFASSTESHCCICFMLTNLSLTCINLRIQDKVTFCIILQKIFKIYAKNIHNMQKYGESVTNMQCLQCAKTMKKICKKCSICKPCLQYAKYALGTLLMPPEPGAVAAAAGRLGLRLASSHLALPVAAGHGPRAKTAVGAVWVAGRRKKPAYETQRPTVVS